MPPGPFSTASSGFVVSGSRPGGSSADQPASVSAGVHVRQHPFELGRLLLQSRSPDFACFVTRSSRRST